MDSETDRLKREIRYLRTRLSILSPSLETMLKRRGFTIYKKEPFGDTLLPGKTFEPSFYEKLKKYSFRLFLRDIIKHQDRFTLEDVTRYATRQISKHYLEFLLDSGTVTTEDGAYRLKKRPVKSFGETLELFVSRLVRIEFHAETAWGVRFKRPHVGGDYDLLAKLDASLLYMEIKSSPPKQIYDNEIVSFLLRVEDLSPDTAIFFVDTELRMKDKIVPMFEQALHAKYGKNVPVQRIRKELFHINNKIFIINSKGGIAENITTVLSFKYQMDYKLA